MRSALFGFAMFAASAVATMSLCSLLDVDGYRPEPVVAEDPAPRVHQPSCRTWRVVRTQGRHWRAECADVEVETP